MSTELISLHSQVTQVYAAASAPAGTVALDSKVTTTAGAASLVSSVVVLASRIDLEDV
jgi:hypothetical protein